MKKIGLVLGAAIMLAAFVFAATLLNSPTACSGQWTNCANAFSDNSARATAGPNKVGTWRNYGFSLGSGDLINSVEVRADFFASRTNGYLQVRVSGDGGSTFGPVHQVGGNTAEQTFWIDVTSDAAWTPSKLSNANLRVNATCVKVGGGSNPTCRLDWIPVRVNYTPFDFSVSLSPTSDSVDAGNSATTTATVTLLSGNSQNVVMGYEGCPTGATCSFSTGNGNPTFSTDFTVATSSSTPRGTYKINVTGTGDGKTRKATYTLTVHSFDFSMYASPASGFVAQGGSIGTTVVSQLVDTPAAQTVSLSVSGCPTNALCTLNVSSGTPTFASLLTIATAATTPVGGYFINVSGVGGGLGRYAIYILNVTA